MAVNDLLMVQKHIRYCLMHLRMLPTAYEAEDCSRMSLAFFVLSSLDLLGATDKIAERDRLAWIDWIYEQQCARGGFSGGPSTRLSRGNLKHDTSHLAMTYTALASLAILRDDFSRLNTSGMRDFLSACQRDDGSFAPFREGQETDVRFVYCAFAVGSFLGGTPPFRLDEALTYIFSCQNYDGAFGQTPGSESQGGTTYCAVASISLAKRIDLIPNKPATIRWLSQRLVCINGDDLHLSSHLSDQGRLLQHALNDPSNGGFQGRPEKDPDVCYSFWIGGSLSLLDASLGADFSIMPADSAPCGLLQLERYQYFLYGAQSQLGGLGKYLGEPPDVYHTYLGLAGLAAGNAPVLGRIDVKLNITRSCLSLFPIVD